MIWYIVTDDAEQYRQPHFHRIKILLEERADDCCLAVHYRYISRKLLSEARPWAICHSGGSALYDDYDVLQHEGYADCILNWDIPQIGFCGGHQIISTKFGSRIGWMRRLTDDEPDQEGYRPRQFKEWGIYPVRIVHRDPLFEGMGGVIRVREAHSWEVLELGPELRLLASGDTCRVQAYVHTTKPVYGVQFHPEGANTDYPDGWQILKNFFSLARRYKQ